MVCLVNQLTDNMYLQNTKRSSIFGTYSHFRYEISRGHSFVFNRIAVVQSQCMIRLRMVHLTLEKCQTGIRTLIIIF